MHQHLRPQSIDDTMDKHQMTDPGNKGKYPSYDYDFVPL